MITTYIQQVVFPYYYAGATFIPGQTRSDSQQLISKPGTLRSDSVQTVRRGENYTN